MANKLSASREFAREISSQNLQNIYIDHVWLDSTRGRDGVAPNTVINQIQTLSADISRKLRSGEYRFTDYREILKLKGAQNYPRVISIPTARDRIALRAIANVLQRVFSDQRGTRPQPLVEKLRSELASNNFDSFIRLDLKNFYPSIDHGILIQTLRKRIRKPELIRVIQAAIETSTVSDGQRRSKIRNGVGVPQGLSISNLLAEIYVSSADKRINEIRNIAYYRYVDDIIILCNASQVDLVKKQVLHIFASLHLNCHPFGVPGSKSSSGQFGDFIEYLGYKFSPGLVSVRESSIQRIESGLTEVLVQYSQEAKSDPSNLVLQKELKDQCLKKLNLRIAGCTFGHKDFGWVRYYSQINDLKLLMKLDVAVKRLLRRFNMPADFLPKTFIRTYWHVNKPREGSSYIPNFDNYTTQEMKDFLKVYFRDPKAMHLSDQEVYRTFKVKVGRVTKAMDRDVRPNS